MLIVDAGSSIDRRNCPARKIGHCVGCQPCGIMQGWAGAGAFSDGKLSLSRGGGRQPARLSAAADGARWTDPLLPTTSYLALRRARPGARPQRPPRWMSSTTRPASYNIQLVPCPVRHLGTEYAFDVLRAMYRNLCQQRPTSPFWSCTSCEGHAHARTARCTGAIHQRGAARPSRSRAPYVVAAPGRGGRCSG